MTVVEYGAELYSTYSSMPSCSYVSVSY